MRSASREPPRIVRVKAKAQRLAKGRALRYLEPLMREPSA
jgi:hypothetical protein